MNDSDLYREEDSRKSQNKGAILAQERCTVLRPLFAFALPPTPSSLDYVPPEVVSPETSLLGFFLTEASKRIPYREPERTLETFVSYVPNRPLSVPLPPSQRLSTPLERPLELSP